MSYSDYIQDIDDSPCATCRKTSEKDCEKCLAVLQEREEENRQLLSEIEANHFEEMAEIVKPEPLPEPAPLRVSMNRFLSLASKL
jgi:hypothetical protein